MPTGDGRIAASLRWLHEAVTSLHPVQTPGILTSQQTRGVVRKPLSESLASSSKPILCRLAREGADALKCRVDGTTTDIIVAKPFNLQAVNATAVNKPLHQGAPETIFVNEGVALFYYYQLTEFRRTFYISGQPYPPTVDGRVIQAITPVYNWMQADKDLDPTLQVSLLAQRINTGLKVDPMTLAYDAAGDDVLYMDLNVDARRWEKVTQATNSEWVEYQPGLPNTYVVRENVI
jgi:hypothetical protein